MSTITSAAGVVLLGKIFFTLLMWWIGEEGKRSLRAQELSSLMAKIQKEGDNLGKQIKEELNRHSKEDWNDISPREG